MKVSSLSALVAAFLASVPSFASDAKPAHHKKRSPEATAMHTTHVHQRDVATHAPPARPCLHAPVVMARGTEEDRFSLTRCDGSATPESVDHLSSLARPDSLPRWSGHGPLPSGMKRVDARLAERLQQVADHFARGTQPVSMHIVSGWRPASVGSFHATAQAIDFRVDGVRNEELVAFCKTLQDTGCGYYPNSSFVHLDVRASGTGHVTWIDASGPGEVAHYVAAWPPPVEPHETTTLVAEKVAAVLPPLE